MSQMPDLDAEARQRTDDHTAPTPCMVCGDGVPIGAPVRPLTDHRTGSSSWWRICRACEREHEEAPGAILTGIIAAAVNGHLSIPDIDPTDRAALYAMREVGPPLYAIDAIGVRRHPLSAPRPARWAFPDIEQWAKDLVERIGDYQLRPAPNTGLPCPRCGRSRSRGWAEVSGGGPGQRVWVCAAAPGEHRHEVARADGYCGGIHAWTPQFHGQYVDQPDRHDIAVRRNPSAPLPHRFFGCRDRAALEAAGIARRVRQIDTSDIVGDFAIRSGWWSPEEDPRWGTSEWGRDWGAWGYLGAGAPERLAQAHRALTDPVVVTPDPVPEPVTVEPPPRLSPPGA